jgi:ASPIC/UnbV protein/VCBS repeat protein/type IX secretion system substrate protein
MNSHLPKKYYSILLTSLFYLLSFQAVGQPFLEVASNHGITQTYGFAIFGGGLSFCDFNGDGWDDLTFATESGDSLLFFVNEEGQFTWIPTLVHDLGEAKQVLWVDYDNDGDKDLFVTNNESLNKLYNNDGHLNLTDVSEVSGLSSIPKSSYGASFGDYDNDGWLDLYICHRYSNSLLFTNELYHNDGSGHFVEVGEITNASDSIRPTFCASFLDFNADGLQDIYISNDRLLARNTLLKNTGLGNFEDISDRSKAGIYLDAMTVTVGDYDNDGDQDIYVTNSPFDGNMLLRNNGDETFEELATECGVITNRFCWGANFYDFDNDTDLDLYVCAMDVNPDKPSAFYSNDGTGNFSHSSLPGDTVRSYSNAVGDFNNDGYPDIAVSSMHPFPFMLFENKSESNGHWLKINLQGTKSNRDGIGTWLEVYFAGQKIIRYTHCGEGYLAQNSSSIHVGLGDATIIDSIKVKWLSGLVDQFYEVSVDQILFVEEGSTVKETPNEITINWNILPNPAKDIIWVTTDIPFYEFISYTITDQLGRVIATGKIQPNLPLDVSKLATGVYYLNLDSFSNILPFVISR